MTQVGTIEHELMRGMFVYDTINIYDQPTFFTVAKNTVHEKKEIESWVGG